MISRKLAGLLALLALPTVAAAQDPAMIATNDSGDTAWILTSSALVLMMTLPGLALFYGGLVRSKNFLSVLIQCGAVACVASVLWIVVGYTLAFGSVSNGWIGAGNAWMLNDIGTLREGTTMPESTFALFQMTFAVITPALMIGAWVDRARFGWVLGFCALWGLVVYAPVAHWIWGGGWMSEAFGTVDFAGGLVVHTTAGVSALVIALLLGRRKGFPEKPLLPHAPGLTMVGAALLWVGWFGFNGGSAFTATDDASSAIINTCHNHSSGWFHRSGSGNPARHHGFGRLLRRDPTRQEPHGYRRFARRIRGSRRWRHARRPDGRYLYVRELWRRRLRRRLNGRTIRQSSDLDRHCRIVERNRHRDPRADGLHGLPNARQR